MVRLRTFSKSDKAIEITSDQYELSRYVYPPVYMESSDRYTDIPLGTRVKTFISKDGKYKIVYYFESVHNKWRIFKQELSLEYQAQLKQPKPTMTFVGRQEAWRRGVPPIISRVQWNARRGNNI